jgi:sec-independent protein translocase protein TatB
MFDIGFSELIVIGVVALIVIGPERLPKVARTLGHLLGRAQRYVNDVKSDINREMQLDELKKLQTQVSESARSIEDSVRKEYDAARTAVEVPAQAAVAELSAPVPPAAAPVSGDMAAAPAPATATPGAAVAVDAVAAVPAAQGKASA